MWLKKDHAAEIMSDRAGFCPIFVLASRPFLLLVRKGRLRVCPETPERSAKSLHGIKKQIWLTKEENELLQTAAQRTCLTEAEYIRMLLKNRIPKEKPDAEFYEVMSQITQFSEQLQNIVNQFEEAVLQEEIYRWHQFQLAIEERFLTPEKVSWL